MNTIAITAAADQLAAELRDRRTGHAAERCDALDPCSSCTVGRLTVAAARRLASVPAQRTAVTRTLVTR